MALILLLKLKLDSYLNIPNDLIINLINFQPALKQVIYGFLKYNMAVKSLSPN